MERNNDYRIKPTMTDKFFKNFDKHLSKIKLYTPLSITPEKLLESNLTLEVANMIEVESTMQYLEAIFQHKSGFYIYLSRKEISESSFKIKIYFYVDKINDVAFFIKSIMKLKNGN